MTTDGELTDGLPHRTHYHQPPATRLRFHGNVAAAMPEVRLRHRRGHAALSLVAHQVAHVTQRRRQHAHGSRERPRWSASSLRVTTTARATRTTRRGNYRKKINMAPTGLPGSTMDDKKNRCPVISGRDAGRIFRACAIGHLVITYCTYILYIKNLFYVYHINVFH